MNNFPSGAEVLRLRAQYAPGTRVELTAPMQDPYASSSQTSLSSTADLSAISARSVVPPLPTKHAASWEPLKAGERATVRGVDDAGHILCWWDTGSSLNSIPGVDPFKIVGVFTEEIKSQILEIRAEGRTNMFDITTVQRFAYEKGFFALVNFIEDDRAAYIHFVLRGE